MDAASTARSKLAHDPMGESRFHKVLVFTDTLERLPSFILILIFVTLSALLAFVWPPTFLIPELYLLAVALNWVILWLLPRTGRSYGPEKASVLAIAFVLFAAALILGAVGSAADAYPVVHTIFLGFAAAFTGLIFYSTWIEPFNLRVTEETLTTPKLRDGSTVRLLHLGDLHLEHITPRERHLNRLVESLKPDVIVFSGDFVNLSNTYDPQTFMEIREIISAWHAPLGVYCVPGTYTVEPLERVREFTDGLDNLQLLTDECVTINTNGGAFHILGMVTRHLLEQDQRTFTKLSDCAPKEEFRLLLTHAPDVAPQADAAEIDLYVCGHTHGGQIRLPFIGALFSGSHLGKRFVMGRYDLTHTTVYTSRGIGLEGLGAPRARFLCPPEIIVWEIRGQH
jgi:uncharacterized protein